MTSTQILSNGTQVVVRSTTIINGTTIESRQPATVLYFDNETNTYTLCAASVRGDIFASPSDVTIIPPRPRRSRRS